MSQASQDDQPSQDNSVANSGKVSLDPESGEEVKKEEVKEADQQSDKKPKSAENVENIEQTNEEEKPADGEEAVKQTSEDEESNADEDETQPVFKTMKKMTQKMNEVEAIKEDEAEEGKVDEENEVLDASMDEKLVNNKVNDLFSRIKAIEDKHIAFRDITDKQLSLINKDVTKQFKYINEEHDALTGRVNDNTTTLRRNIQSNTDTTRIIQENLDQIQDLIRMGRAPGGALGQISMRVQDDIEKGPI